MREVVIIRSLVFFLGVFVTCHRNIPQSLLLKACPMCCLTNNLLRKTVQVYVSLALSLVAV